MWELCHVLLNGAFYSILGEMFHLGLVMGILSVQLFLLLLYSMHLTVEIEKLCFLAVKYQCYIGVSLGFPDFC